MTDWLRAVGLKGTAPRGYLQKGDDHLTMGALVAISTRGLGQGGARLLTGGVSGSSVFLMTRSRQDKGEWKPDAVSS